MQELVKSVSIENMLNQRNAAIEKIRQAQMLLIEAQDLTVAGHFGSLRFEFEPYNGSHRVSYCDANAIEGIMKSIDAQGWQYLMKESGLRTFMDAKARTEWDEGIRNHNIPEFSKENITATFESLYSARGAMFERGVISVFRKLSWNFKTNEPFKFGKRIIMSYLLSSYGSLDHRSCDELDDLMRVFRVLDNKLEQDHRYGMYYEISAAMRDSAIYENDYLQIKWYKKGTGHVLFKRLDIIDTMNKILAKHFPNAVANDK